MPHSSEQNLERGRRAGLRHVVKEHATLNVVWRCGCAGGGVVRNDGQEIEIEARSPVMHGGHMKRSTSSRSASTKLTQRG